MSFFSAVVLERFNVPPAPVHLSNSTDPFQTLEKDYGHTKLALEKILKHKKRVTTVTILTKNPLLAAQSGYIELFKALLENQEKDRVWPGFVIEISLAFWRDKARCFYDVGAPTVQDRVKGIRALYRAGIPLVLRIDPLFPRSPITKNPAGMTDFELPEAQTQNDLENLISLAKEVNVKHIVYSAAKIIQPRGRTLPKSLVKLREVYYAYAAPEKLVWRGGSWRLPASVIHQKVISPFLDICRDKGVSFKFCKQNLIETP